MEMIGLSVSGRVGNLIGFCSKLYLVKGIYETYKVLVANYDFL